MLFLSSFLFCFLIDTTMVYFVENCSSSLNEVEGLTTPFKPLTTGGLPRAALRGRGQSHRSARVGPVTLLGERSSFRLFLTLLNVFKRVCK